MTKPDDETQKRPPPLARDWIIALVIGAVAGVLLNMGVDTIFSALVGVIFAIAYMTYRRYATPNESNRAGQGGHER